jgi:hypothetical protein
MNLQELRRACCSQIADGHKHIILETESTRLLVSHGPVGELMCINSKGKHVVLYDAMKVLQYVIKLEKYLRENNASKLFK